MLRPVATLTHAPQRTEQAFGQRLTKAALEQIVVEFNNLDIGAPLEELVVFASRALNLNQSQSANIFPDAGAPDDDPKHIQVDRVASRLIARRKQIVEEESRIPDAIISRDKHPIFETPIYHIGGLESYLLDNQESIDSIGRIKNHDAVRAYLAALGDGYKLENLAAVILQELHSNCFATRRAFDQGIDCVSSRAILELYNWCCGEDLLRNIGRLGEKVHIFTSCKANEGNTAQGLPDTIPPAHVRELIGGWLIQRSDSGMWNRRAGVKLLSPLQLLLATTYRLSDSSMSLCRELGVAVWEIPQLIYLICAHAPPTVFPIVGNSMSFSSVEMDAWVETAEADRVVIV